MNQGRLWLPDLFGAAVRRVDPAKLVAEHLRRTEDGLVVVSGERTLARLDRGRLWLVAAGKAATGMAQASLAVLGDHVVAGVVAAPQPTGRWPRRVRAIAAGHPLPDRGSLAAGREAWRLAGQARPGDTLLVLLSGGASSLLVLPAPGLRLADKVRVTSLLLRSGASIAEVNCVRKHLSRLKGGGLARRAGEARVVSLSLSDVVGSSPAVIGSGPAAPDATTYEDAWQILGRRGLCDQIPVRVRRHLERGRRGALAETLKPGERRVTHVLVGDNRLALSAAAERAERLGFEPRLLTAALRGDTTQAARRFAAEIRRARRTDRRLCILAGGETTVEVRGDGLGGRNQHFALALAREIRGMEYVVCLSAGSDGVDGPTDAAGAFVDSTTFARAARRGLDPDDFLRRSDSYRFFEALGDLFKPGPTGTNVMDLKIALIGR